MDSRRWWLLAAAVPVALGCALATARPELTLAGQLSIIAAGLLAAVVLCRTAPRTTRPVAWRLLSTVALLPVIGTVLTLAAGPLDPVTVAVLRWAPTVPGYVLAIIAVLSLVERRRLRAGARVAVEVALFLTACLVVVALVLVGPAGRWVELALTERLVLGSAVVVTSATMAAALTLLGVIETGRRSMAVVLLAGSVFLTLGRGLATSALLAGTPPISAGVARGLIVAGLLLLALAVLMDADSSTDATSRRLFDAMHLLPHLALLVAVGAVGGTALMGSRPTVGMIAGLLGCVGLATTHRWLTAREAQFMDARLRRSEAYFRSLVESSGDAVVIVDGTLRVTWTSKSLERALGAVAGHLRGRSLLEAVHPDDAPALAAALPAGDDGSAVPADPAGLLLLRLLDAGGAWRYLEAGVSDLRDDPDVGAVVLHCRDMTDRHDREQALLDVAYIDPSTGLPNRARLLQSLEQALAGPGELPASLLVIELDGLALAQENAGREATSTVVTEVARRLRGTVRGEDVVACIGGSAFAVLAHGDGTDTDRLAARCLAVVEQPIATAGEVVDLTADVGLVTLEAGLGVAALLARGDLAVRAAREAGPGSAVRYEAAHGAAAARRERLRTDLQSARAREELFLLFQPIVSITEQRITGLEAQLHWRHGTLGEIPPAEFLPLAERAGLMGELVRWAIEEVTAVGAGLPRDGATRVGLKLPVGYLATGAVVNDVEHALRRSGLPPERLVLQIGAPDVASEDDRTALDISTLRLMGVHVALQGFGNTTSGLGHLTRLPIDVLKLDRSLINRIDRDPQSRALCESLVGIGHALGLDVTAEGVETPAQLAALSAFGCDFVQGFLLGRPQSLAEFLVTMPAGVSLPGLAGAR